VVVYYDRLNPGVNALEDFSEQSRKNMRFVYILLIALAAVVAFLVWNRTPYRNSNELAP
jgi:UDP-N-acetylmuramyl pentapeptide phosphotransferase/UDP-N-acetylglucosamine-1-phosphate transferase